MSWILELKAGDKFHDSTRKFVGTVVATDEEYLHYFWTPEGYSPWEHTSIKWDKVLANNAWLPITPLIQALL